MIKKLYSADCESDSEQRKKSETRNRSNAHFSEEPADTRTTEKLNNAISDRAIFSYGYSRFWFVKHFSRAVCLCCKAKSKRQDFLFKEAKKKLYYEIDLLEIVKQLRINMFASDIVLKPRQRHLVSFFDEYKLKEKKKSILKSP